MVKRRSAIVVQLSALFGGAATTATPMEIARNLFNEAHLFLCSRCRAYARNPLPPFSNPLYCLVRGAISYRVTDRDELSYVGGAKQPNYGKTDILIMSFR